MSLCPAVPNWPTATQQGDDATRTFEVVVAPQALEQPPHLYRYVAHASVPDVAARRTYAILDCGEGLRHFARRCTRLNDVRPGMRVANCRKPAVIALAVVESRFSVLAVFDGGQDLESMLRVDSRKGALQ